MLKIDFEYLGLDSKATSKIAGAYLKFTRNPCSGTLDDVLIDCKSSDFRVAVCDYNFYRHAIDYTYRDMSRQQQKDILWLYKEVISMEENNHRVIEWLTEGIANVDIKDFCNACLDYINNCII